MKAENWKAQTVRAKWGSVAPRLMVSKIGVAMEVEPAEIQ